MQSTSLCISTSLLTVTVTALVIFHHAKIIPLFFPFVPIQVEGRSLGFPADLESLVDMTFMNTVENHRQLILSVWGRRAGFS